MTEFLEYRQSRNLSHYTLRNYRMTFASFLEGGHFNHALLSATGRQLAATHSNDFLMVIQGLPPHPSSSYTAQHMGPTVGA
jgi:hypothetical protein